MPFREIIGHRRALALLSRAIACDTLTPSLILAGPDGVGKGATSVAIAQALNCVAPRRADQAPELPLDACGECGSCRRIARGAHPDVQTIRPGETGSIKIEQVRASIDAAIYRPFEGRRRVTIVEEADALVPAAQNALLKTLEEPPSASVFILVTSRPGVLLPTVRSRCAQLRFGRLMPADVALVLERKHGYSRQEAEALAAASDGSVRRALDMEAAEFADARRDAENLLRVAGRDARTRIEQGKTLLKGGGTAPAERAHLAMRLEALSSVLRDVGLLASGADPRLLANLDRRYALDALVPTFGRGRAGRAFDAVWEAHEALDQNVGPKVIADWLAVQL
jgi:DNA polymerase-3 subunit delta'